ncbi:MAG: DUF4129 domain-containing protein [Terracidiphilus sp.]
MNSMRFGSRGGNGGGSAGLAPVASLLLVAALLVPEAAAPHAHAQQPPSNGGWRDVNLAEYRQHLQDLDSVVADCQAQLKLKKPASASNNACDPNRVGPNDRVQSPGAAGSEPREVRYDWLRAVLTLAGSKGSASQPAAGAPASAKSKPADPNDLLNDAHQRLQMDERQVESPLETNLAYADERRSLNTILAQREYQGVTKVSVRDRFLEWLGNLLDKIVMKLAGMGARAPWAARLLEGLLLGGICIALVWFFIRLERSGRVRLIPDVESGPGAPSAREWQSWYQEAGDMAAKSQWREAIHSLYWASISLLESRRLWPADRARTPREYLGLLAGDDPRKVGLTALTRSFERTWYGGGDAAASDFNAALEHVRTLGLEVKSE